MKRSAAIISALVATFAASSALAHELRCEQRFDGKQLITVDAYPATIHVTVAIHNTHPTATSIVDAIVAPILSGEGLSFELPLSLAVGASSSDGFDITLNSEADCLRLAALDGVVDARIVSSVEVVWDLGSSQCSAEIVCKPQVCK